MKELWLWFIFSFLWQVSTVLADPLSAETPVDVQPCEPSFFTWNGGIGPYAITFLSPGQLSNDYLALAFSGISGESFVTPLPFNANSNVQLTIDDANGNTTVTSFVMQAGGDTSCVYFTNWDTAADQQAENQPITFTTPTQEDALFSCDTATPIEWSGGKAPYTVIIRSVNLDIMVEQVVSQSTLYPSTSLSSTIHMPAGVTVQISVIDSLGNVGVSDEITISQASDTSCIIHNEATLETPRHRILTNVPTIILPTPTQGNLLSPDGPSETSSTSSAPSSTRSSTPSVNSDPELKSGGSKVYVYVIPVVLVVLFFLGIGAWGFNVRMKRKRIEKRGVQEIRQASDTGLSPISPTEGRTVGGSRSAMTGIRRGGMDNLLPTPYILPTLPGRALTPQSTPGWRQRSHTSLRELEEGPGRPNRRSISERLAGLLHPRSHGSDTAASRRRSRASAWNRDSFARTRSHLEEEIPYDEKFAVDIPDEPSPANIKCKTEVGLNPALSFRP